MINEIVFLRATIGEKEKRIRHLEKMIKQDDRSTILNESYHEDMIIIMEDHHEKIINSYPEDSFQRIFWTTQYNMAKQKSKMGYRWNPAIIRWCIYLRHKSSSSLLLYYLCYDVVARTTSIVFDLMQCFASDSHDTVVVMFRCV